MRSLPLKFSLDSLICAAYEEIEMIQHLSDWALRVRLCTAGSTRRIDRYQNNHRHRRHHCLIDPAHLIALKCFLRSILIGTPTSNSHITMFSCSSCAELCWLPVSKIWLRHLSALSMYIVRIRIENRSSAFVYAIVTGIVHQAGDFSMPYKVECLLLMKVSMFRLSAFDLSENSEYKTRCRDHCVLS